MKFCKIVIIFSFCLTTSVTSAQVDALQPLGPLIVSGSYGEPILTQNRAWIVNRYGLVSFALDGPAQDVPWNIPVPGLTKSAIVHPDHAFVLTDRTGLKVVSLTGGSQGECIARVPIEGFALALAEDQQYLFVIAETENDPSLLMLNVIDISDPGEPELLVAQEIGAYNGSRGVAIYSGRLYVLCYSDMMNSLLIINISDPAQPFIENTEDIFEWGYDIAISVSDSIAVVTEFYSGVVIVDLTDPVNPSVLSRMPMTVSPRFVSLEDTIVAISIPTEGVRLLSLANPVSPHEVSRIGLYLAMGIKMRGNNLVVGANENGYARYSLTTPSNPELRARYIQPQHPEVIAPGQNRVYLLSPDQLYSMEWSLSGSGELISQDSVNYLATDALVENDYLYVGTLLDGLVVYQLDDFGIPEEISRHPVGSEFGDNVAIHDSLLVFTHDNGLTIFNIANPLQIEPLSSDYSGTFMKEATIYQHYLYVLDSGIGLLVYNIQDPEHPVLLGTYLEDFYPTKMAYANEQLYAANDDSLLLLLPELDPTNPPIISGISLIYATSAIVATSSALIIAEAPDLALRLYNCSNPEYPVLVADTWSPDAVIDLATWGNYLFVADESGSTFYDITPNLSIMDQTTIVERPSFNLTASPNPFNGIVIIRFTLPSSALTRLVLYDLLGRQVAKLLDGWRDPGMHAVTIEASSYASGNYFLKLSSGNHVSTRRITLIK